ncbi:hypothetical protein [Pseudoalteromonas sp. MMG012]|uniref:hypothetical protein n=1 Tax=Pseudoalteromonas sp. MMG012 TaxID=2822686 RepID=UPI001B3A0CF4|nr:hypothetical protein [Pseudoalteromonas sp. MMG012]MBQ4851041.1 hypothetical protein [Pseudoalteromonas sp. MMG012]
MSRVSYKSIAALEELLEVLKSDFQANDKKFHKSVYREYLSIVLAHLLYAKEHECRVRYSRSTSHCSGSLNAEIIIKLLDFLGKLGLIKQHIAAPVEGNPEQSTFWPTEKFASYSYGKFEWKNIVFVGTGILLRDKDKVELPLPKSAKHLLSRVSKVNSLLQNTIVLQDNKKQKVALTRIFKHSLDLGGRFYTRNEVNSYQTSKKEHRKLITIDGYSTKEIDFKAMHLNMLYAWAGIKIARDPYIIEGLERGLVKALVLRFVNSENLSAFKAAVTRSANSEFKHKMNCPIERAKVVPEARESFIEGLPDGMTGGEAYGYLSSAYADISEYIAQENIGLKLQNTDSKIMDAILVELCDRGIAALPMHDSVIVKESDVLTAQEVMKKAYKDIMGGYEIDVSVT